MKTPEACYREVAQHKKLPYDLVKKVNQFFWKEGVKKHMQEVKVDAVFIKNFGTIAVSRNKLRMEISKTINYIRKLRKSTKFTENKKNILLTHQIDNLRVLLKKRNDVAHFYCEVKKSRDARKEAKKRMGNIETVTESNIQLG